MHRQTMPLLSGKNKCAAADLHITPDRTLLYASERTSNTLHAFRVQQGTVSRLTATRCEATPRGFAIDPDGRFLLCAGQTDNAIGIYAIDSATGGLMRRARHATGPNPNWIEIIDL